MYAGWEAKRFDGRIVYVNHMTQVISRLLLHVTSVSSSRASFFLCGCVFLASVCERASKRYWADLSGDYMTLLNPAHPSIIDYAVPKEFGSDRRRGNIIILLRGDMNAQRETVQASVCPQSRMLYGDYLWGAALKVHYVIRIAT